MVGAVALGLILAAESGYVAPLAASVAIALVLYRIESIPEPEPVTKHYTTRTEGITEREAMDYLIFTNELDKMREEEVEKSRKKAERKGRI